MATYVDSAAVGAAEDVTTVETAGVSVSGTDKWFFGVSAGGGFFPTTVDTTAFRHGGSGGVSMTQLGSDVTLANVLVNAWQASGPADGSRTAHATLFEACQSASILGAVYSGVSPIGTPQTNSNTVETGANAYCDCSITVTGLTTGRTVLAFIGAFTLNVNGSSFSQNSGEGTLRDSAIAVLAAAGTALVDKVASGSSETLSVRYNLSSTDATVQFVAIAVELTDASAGSITRPNSDVQDTGWTNSTGADSFALLDETSASDADYITSPPLGGGSPIIMGLTTSLAAGTYTIRVRAKYSRTSAQIRISLLNGSNVSQGISDWQALTASETTYNIPVVTTGAATRVQIETQA